ncbi:MAG: hypothetical protein NVSMB57_05390 [Actinomycetota bacterium]
MKPLVQCIDHVVTPTDDYEHLFSLFAEGLGLPVAWPPGSFGEFFSAGITLGNGGIEIVRDNNSGIPFFESRLPVIARGIALRGTEPLAEIAGALTERGIKHDGVQPFGKRKDGSPIGSILLLHDMLGDECAVYFIEYPGAELMCGQASEKLFEQSGGGIVGATRFAEVQLGVTNLNAAIHSWQTLLAPSVPSDEACWTVGDGPAICLKESPIVGVAGLVLEVKALEEARNALARINLLGPSRASGCGLRHPETQGLDVWLTE